MSAEMIQRLVSHKPEILTILAGDGSTKQIAPDRESVTNHDWFDHIDPSDHRILLGPRKFPDACKFCCLRSRHPSGCPVRHIDELTQLPNGQFRGKRLDQCPTNYLRQIVKFEWRWVPEALKSEAERIIYRRQHFGEPQQGI